MFSRVLFFLLLPSSVASLFQVNTKSNRKNNQHKEGRKKKVNPMRNGEQRERMKIEKKK